MPYSNEAKDKAQSALARQLERQTNRGAADEASAALARTVSRLYGGRGARGSPGMLAYAQEGRANFTPRSRMEDAAQRKLAHSLEHMSADKADRAQANLAKAIERNAPRTIAQLGRGGRSGLRSSMADSAQRKLAHSFEFMGDSAQRGLARSMDVDKESLRDRAASDAAQRSLARQLSSEGMRSYMDSASADLARKMSRERMHPGLRRIHGLESTLTTHLQGSPAPRVRMEDINGLEAQF